MKQRGGSLSYRDACFAAVARADGEASTASGGAASKTWRRRQGKNQLLKVSVKVGDVVEVVPEAKSSA
jgi:hypothetical protein